MAGRKALGACLSVTTQGVWESGSRPLLPPSLACLPILLRLVDSPFQSATERDQLCTIMVPERNFPRPPVNGGIGVDVVGLIDNPDSSHETFSSLTRRKSDLGKSQIARELSTVAQSDR
jgi:hypothetical protein